MESGCFQSPVRVRAIVDRSECLWYDGVACRRVLKKTVIVEQRHQHVGCHSTSARLAVASLRTAGGVHRCAPPIGACHRMSALAAAVGGGGARQLPPC